MRAITIVEEIEGKVEFTVALSPEMLADSSFGVATFNGSSLDECLEESDGKDILTQVTSELASTLAAGRTGFHRIYLAVDRLQWE